MSEDVKKICRIFIRGLLYIVKELKELVKEE